MERHKLLLSAEDVHPVIFEIPSSQGKFQIQILNEDVERGVVTSIVHLPPGGRIPAHFHRAGSEMHYLLEGDLEEAGTELRPGAFLTYPAGVVHGPHESRTGAKVLTVQTWQSQNGDLDFHLAEDILSATVKDDAKTAADGAAKISENPVAEGSEGDPRAAETALGKGYG